MPRVFHDSVSMERSRSVSGSRPRGTEHIVSELRHVRHACTLVDMRTDIFQVHLANLRYINLECFRAI